ncbi:MULTISPECIES: alpha/beta fold hydrolase [Paenibacillus]|uniref:alpha/beta fold hydrolase n=1 Tax=Paenibacillus TaxID=44249 RepID=UPI0022B89202|nr:alpha/beta fold hydrolase [Paenibacillus caseinilyticus]MCZ8518338.1 alpha/beta fold hydrolase [Paenibacillus caseinilyticus]
MSCLTLVLLGLAAAGVVYLRPYGADEQARYAMNGSTAVEVKQEAHWLHFEPQASGRPAGSKPPARIILYPGGLVQPQSYAPLASRLAEKGYPVSIARMPLNLAVFGEDRAEELLQREPQADVVIGGHSLGGSMAARFAASHPQEVRGVFLLAAYADEGGNLRDAGLPVLSLTGTNDRVVNAERMQAGRAYVPPDAVYLSVDGGNHARFGSYGPQRGDGEAAIPAEEQWERTVEALRAWGPLKREP